MLEHCVFCDIRQDADAAELSEIMGLLAGLATQVDGFLSFRTGPNRDYENKSRRFSMGFICTFRDREAHLAYERHPVHRAAGARLVALCHGGYDGITVFDLEVQA